MQALSGSDDCNAQVRTLLEAGASVDEVYRWLVTTDKRCACDVLARTWTETGGRDGFVSVEVTPEAFETLTAEGMSLNVTLVFSLDRYREIATRYVSAIERFVEAGGDARACTPSPRSSRPRRGSVRRHW